MALLQNLLIGSVAFTYLFSSYPGNAAPLTDIISTNAGDLEITIIKDASLMFRFQELVIMIDIAFSPGRYKSLPPPDTILITHDHAGDHFSSYFLKKYLALGTQLIVTRACYWQLGGKGMMMENGDVKKIGDVQIEAVAAYDEETRHPRVGTLYHPKGKGNGYILTFGNKRVYVSGDTKLITEMEGFQNIDIAFMALGLPYVMSREMMANAARIIKPKILYPYHLDSGRTDPNPLIEMLKDKPEIEIRIRDTREQKVYNE